MSHNTKFLLFQAGTLSDSLFGIIDKALTQPNRPPIVHEGLCAAHLIITLESADYTLGMKSRCIAYFREVEIYNTFQL